MSNTWKTFTPEKYREETGRLVHFNAKTVNSNAALVGIRLEPEAALDLPYISLRTLLGGGFTFPLDYAEGGAAVAGIMKQINLILADAPEAAAAGPEEKAAVKEGIREARSSAYSTGTKRVDHRLRQVLIPKADAADGYVSMTPITSGSLCALFFAPETGLVTCHNAAAKADPEGPLRRLRQAQFGIGGANPQNVGCLVRSMQRPLMVGAPGFCGSVRAAFALYHKGVDLDVHAPGGFHQAVRDYAAFREQALLVPEGLGRITMETRQEEERLVARIARAVLDLAAEARETLITFAHLLPQEELIPQTDPEVYALVSPKVRPTVLRGLLDPNLRPLCAQWPRKMAELTVARMLAANARTGLSLLRLDGAARSGLEGIMEGVFR